MKVIVLDSADKASEFAAGIVSEQLRKKPASVFLIPTDRTSLGLYANLAKLVKEKKTSFAKAKAFSLDEYLGIERNGPHSFYNQAWENFLGKTDIRKENTFIFDSEAKNPELVCRGFEGKIRETGIDLAILGIGVNGHIAFDEPGTPFDSETHTVRLSETTIKANAPLFDSEKDVPRRAYTVGLGTIMRAKKIIQLAFGEKKAKAIRAALEEKPSEQVPASVLQKHNDVTIILDREAASLLSRTKVENK